jgi:hypothetical protein
VLQARALATPESSDDHLGAVVRQLTADIAMHRAILAADPQAQARMRVALTTKEDATIDDLITYLEETKAHYLTRSLHRALRAGGATGPVGIASADGDYEDNRVGGGGSAWWASNTLQAQHYVSTNCNAFGNSATASGKMVVTHYHSSNVVFGPTTYSLPAQQDATSRTEYISANYDGAGYKVVAAQNRHVCDLSWQWDDPYKLSSASYGWT